VDQLQIVITVALEGDPKAPTAVFSADPELEKVPWGTSPTLMWTLKASGAPASGARFAPQKGIFFTPSTTYPAHWPNAQPTPVAGSDGLQYSVVDANQALHKQDITYKYTVAVVVNGHVYAWDPEDENEGKGSN
jgi:hypothetical protein